MKYLLFWCCTLLFSGTLLAQVPRYALVIGIDQGNAAAVWLCHAGGIYGIEMMRKKPLLECAFSYQ